MTRIEYLLPLVSVLIGLAIADLVASLHRLLRARDRVRWHWLPLQWAAVTFLILLAYWWSFYDVAQAAVWNNLFAFGSHIALLIILYLVAAAALPDRADEGNLDLLQDYLRQRRYFFGLYALYFSYSLVDVWLRTGILWRPLSWLVLVYVAVFLLLAWTDRVRVHAIVSLAVAVFTIFLIAQYYARLPRLSP